MGGGRGGWAWLLGGGLGAGRGGALGVVEGGRLRSGCCMKEE